MIVIRKLKLQGKVLTRTLSDYAILEAGDHSLGAQDQILPSRFTPLKLLTFFFADIVDVDHISVGSGPLDRHPRLTLFAKSFDHFVDIVV